MRHELEEYEKQYGSSKLSELSMDIRNELLQYDRGEITVVVKAEQQQEFQLLLDDRDDDRDNIVLTKRTQKKVVMTKIKQSADISRLSRIHNHDYDDSSSLAPKTMPDEVASRFVPLPEIEELCSEYLEDYRTELDNFAGLSTFQGDRAAKGKMVKELLPPVGKAVERIIDQHRDDWSTQCTEDALVQHLWYLIQKKTSALVAPHKLFRLYQLIASASPHSAAKSNLAAVKTTSESHSEQTGGN
jgi:hypothetical protein